jgi:hypothetical protein
MSRSRKVLQASSCATAMYSTVWSLATRTIAQRLRRRLSQHRRSQPEATKFMAATTTQSVAITCAQIATIPTNSASEASVAISSTMARPMLLTRQCPKIQRVRVLECAFSRPTLGKALVSLVALVMERFNCTPNTRFIVNVSGCLNFHDVGPVVIGAVAQFGRLHVNCIGHGEESTQRASVGAIQRMRRLRGLDNQNRHGRYRAPRAHGGGRSAGNGTLPRPGAATARHKLGIKSSSVERIARSPDFGQHQYVFELWPVTPRMMTSC